MRKNNVCDLEKFEEDGLYFVLWEHAIITNAIEQVKHCLECTDKCKERFDFIKFLDKNVKE
jgi:hypothetical protein